MIAFLSLVFHPRLTSFMISDQPRGLGCSVERLIWIGPRYPVPRSAWRQVEQNRKSKLKNLKSA